MTKRSDQVGWLPWLAGILFFPSGMFILLASAGAVSWIRAVLLTVLSYATLTGFAWMMGELEKGEVRDGDKLVGLLAGFVVIVIWARCAYVLGRRAGFWSRLHLRGWRRLGGFAYGLTAFLVLFNAARVLAEIRLKVRP